MEAERIQVGKCTVVVHRPELTPEERAHRMDAIKKAAVKLVIATEAAKRKKATI